MKYEIYIEKESENSINVTNSRVDSLRINENLQTTARVYEDGKVGIAGAIGIVDENELLERAKANLAQQIPYPCNLTGNLKRSADARKSIIPSGEFVKTVEKLMARLRKEFPDFIFSNKIGLSEGEKSYKNSEGTELFYAGGNFYIGLVIKAADSANIMDLSYGEQALYYDEDGIVNDIGKLLKAYKNPVEMPEEDLPIIVDRGILSYAISEFIAEKYLSGSSLFSNKLGEKIANEKLNVYSDCAPNGQNAKSAVSFFDVEGTVQDDDKFYYIKNGVLSGLITYKRSAANFNLPLSGGANADFDGTPSFGASGLTVGVTNPSLKSAVNGKAIYVCMTSGGDMTPDGTIGLPVMLGYIYENGQLVGKLPEFGLNANLSDVLGNDLIDVCKNDVFSYKDEGVIVAKFKINRNK